MEGIPGIARRVFKEGILGYGSCLSATAGPIFDLRAVLDGVEDEDMIDPSTVFQSIPTWDPIRAQQVPERIPAFRDHEMRQKLSLEAVEVEVTHIYHMGRAQRRTWYNHRWDLVEV